MSTENDLSQTPVITINDLPKRLNEIVQKFQLVASEVDESIDPVVAGTARGDLYTQLRLHYVMDHIKDVCRVLDTMCNRNLPIVAERAEKIMSASDVDAVDFLGRRWKCDTKPYAQTLAADKQLVIDWLKSLESGAYLVSEGYHPLSFQKFVREEILAKGEVPPEFIKVHNKATLSSRKLPGG